MINHLKVELTDDNLRYLGSNHKSYTARLKLTNGQWIHGQSVRLVPSGYIGVYRIDVSDNAIGEYRYKPSEIESLEIRFN